jgi:hypothetical protein
VAEHEHDEQSESDEAASSNGHQIGKVAALAAAGGATAFAAKKAFDSRTSGRSSGSSPSTRNRRRNGKDGSSRNRNSAALLSAALEHGWNAAKDTLTPVVGDASSRAGHYVAEHAPEVVRDVVVPKFIAGFERARSGGRGEDREPPEE